MGLADTAWLAVTMKPSSGSKAKGRSAAGTQPFQSHWLSQPGAGQ